MNIHSVSAMLQSFPLRRILVIGDILLDEYLWGHIERISPEAPVPILNLVRREARLGGAANVVTNLRSLGARVSAFGVVGEDSSGDYVLETMDQLQVDSAGVVRDLTRKSSKKTRLMSLEHGQQVFRFDEESTAWIQGDVEDQLLNHIESAIPRADAILCSDYLKGVLTERILQDTFRRARGRDLPVVVAPKDWNSKKYRGASILVPNVKELARLTKYAIDGADGFDAAAHDVMNNLELESLVVTRGSEGISLFEASGKSLRRVDVPTVARTVYDVTGAGDTFVSMFTLAIATGATREEASRLANVAAGIVVAKRGTASATVPEILERLQDDSRVSVDALVH